MNERAAFVRAICETPDDDTVRLVFADWLSEHDDEPLARYMRAKIASPTCVTILGPSDSVSAFGGVVARGFRAFAGKGVYPNGRLRYRRGFAEEVECTAAMWIDHADALFWHPKQTIPCEYCGGSGNYCGMSYDSNPGPCSGCGGGYRDNPSREWPGWFPGTGRIPRPFPGDTVHPIRDVTFTDRCPVEMFDSDGVMLWVPGMAGSRTWDHAEVCERDEVSSPADLILAELWPGIRFHYPEQTETATDFTFRDGGTDQ